MNTIHYSYLIQDQQCDPCLRRNYTIQLFTLAESHTKIPAICNVCGGRSHVRLLALCHLSF
jgi:hypothetical protein